VVLVGKRHRGRALKNDPVDHFSKGARVQGKAEGKGQETKGLPSLEGSGVVGDDSARHKAQSTGQDETKN